MMKPKTHLICPYCGASSRDDYCICCGSDELLEFPDYLYDLLINSGREDRWKIIDHQQSLKQAEYRRQSKIIMSSHE